MTDTSPLKILQPVSPYTLREGHSNYHLLKPLHESIELNPLSDDIETLLDNIYKKEAVLWKWECEQGSGILITYIRSFPKHPRLLFVTNLRGKGYIENIGLIEADVTQIAKDFNCSHVVGEVMSVGLVKVYERLGAKAIYAMYREVPN